MQPSQPVWRLLSLATNEQRAVHIQLIGRYITPLPFTSRGSGNWPSPRPFHSSSRFHLPASCSRCAGEAVKALYIACRPTMDEEALSYHSIDAPHLHRTGLYNRHVCDCHVKCHATQNQWPAAWGSILTTLRMSARYSRTQAISAASD